MSGLPLRTIAALGLAALLGVAVLVLRARVDARAKRTVRTTLDVVGAVFGVALAVLAPMVLKLPRGAAFSFREVALRSGAELSGVFFVLAVLTALLPWTLDHLEQRGFVSFVAARHVRAQKSGFLTVISILSILAVGLSSCTLSGTISVMGGFSQDLKRKILGNSAHIVIDTEAQTPWGDFDGPLERVRAVPGVVGATPVVQGEVMISSPSNLQGAIVRGIDPDSIRSVVELANNIEVGRFDYLSHPQILAHLPPEEVIGLGPHGEQYLKGTELPSPADDDLDPAVRQAVIPVLPGIVIGRELAKTLHVYVGDDVTLVSPLGDLGPMGVMPRTKRFRVAAIFYSGMYEYDASQVYTMLDVAQEYFGIGDKIHLIDVKVEDAENTPLLMPAVERAIGRKELRVRDWREISKNLFSALKTERFATFVILSIAIVVASFCIVCTLLLMVTEKAKEIAILKALGATDPAILRTFIVEGVVIGGIGTVFGVVMSIVQCLSIAWFGIRLDPEVYYIDRLPVSVNGWDFFSVAVAALTICTLATLYPAHAASKLRPLEGLRYE